MATGEGTRNTATGNLAKPQPITKIKLNNGKEYELAPVNVNILSDIEDKFEKPFHKVFGDGSVKPIRYMLWLRLKCKYPEFDTEEKLGEMIDMDVIYNLSDITGIK